jgi:hypothetical protein
LKKPLTVIRFVVPENLAEVPFGLREAEARFVGAVVEPKMFAAHLKANVGNTVTVAFTSLYGREAKQNLDYLAAKIKLAGGKYEAARDLYAMPHGENQVSELLAKASFPVVGPSFVDAPALLLLDDAA